MISIIIIVKNGIRIEKILEKLRLVAGINNSEIIVVDASCGLLDKIRLKFPEVKWINYKNISSKKATYAEQRNLGIKRAKGNIIVFIDADCIPESQWLNNLTRQILDGKELISAGTVISSPKSYMISNRLKGTYVKECPTMNMALNKKVFDDIGLFDENFERCEDADICIRALKIGGIPCVIDNDENGLLVPPKDPEALAKAIIKILKDPKLAKKMGENGYKKVKENFTWDKQVEKTKKIIELLTKNKEVRLVQKGSNK